MKTMKSTEFKKPCYLKRITNQIKSCFSNLVEPRSVFPEFQGTKGQWFIETGNSYETKIITKTHRVAQVKHYPVSIEENILEPSRDEGRANAHLVANSPELLEALQDLLTDYSIDNRLKAYSVIQKIHCY